MHFRSPWRSPLYLFTAGWLFAGLALLAVAPSPLDASSHREAPSTLEMPQTDGTDFYLFRSYEPGREGFVTLIANYNPLQDPYGGPNFFPLREDAFYDIHIDHDGDAVEDLTFRFKFSNRLPVLVPGDPGLGVPVPLPNGAFVPVGISNVAPAGPGTPPPPPGGAINWIRSYTVRLVRGPINAPAQVSFLTSGSSPLFAMPFDYVGTRAFPDYEAYAAQFAYQVNIPGCAAGRLFVGQRKEPFAVNLGDFFDLVHIPNPIGPRAAQASSLADKNITALALEVPIACLTGGGDSVIAGWTTARLRKNRTLIEDPTFADPYEESGPFVQVSRLGNPLVNEVSIGLNEKNLFNASSPADDDQFDRFFLTPTVPVGIELVTTLFPPPVGTVTPPLTPRNDLVSLYRLGLPGLNADGSGGEVLRLNTATAAVPATTQNNLGPLAGDQAGWPNGRRPGDDVVDTTLRYLEGALCYPPFSLCPQSNAPFGFAPFTDQAWVDATQFDSAFPYLTTPIPGSPQGTRSFAASLSGASGEAVCSALLAPLADPFAPPPDPSPLALSCTFDIAGTPGVELRQGATVVCDLGDSASPAQGSCQLSAAELQALQQGQLTVAVGSLAGALE